MLSVRLFLLMALTMAPLSPARAFPAAPRVILAQAAADDLDSVIAGLETVTAALTAAADPALGAALLAALRLTASDAGDACVLPRTALDDAEDEARMTGHLLRELGLDLAVTPEIATLFTSRKKVGTMVKTLKDRAGSLPGTALYLTRIDAVRDAMDPIGERVTLVMQAAVAEGSVRYEADTIRLAGPGCPG